MTNALVGSVLMDRSSPVGSSRMAGVVMRLLS